MLVGDVVKGGIVHYVVIGLNGRIAFLCPCELLIGRFPLNLVGCIYSLDYMYIDHWTGLLNSLMIP